MTDQEEPTIEQYREILKEQLGNLKLATVDELVQRWACMDFTGMHVDFCLRVMTTIANAGNPEDTMAEYYSMLAEVEAKTPRHFGLARINMETYAQTLDDMLEICPDVLDIMSIQKMPYQEREKVARGFIIISTPVGEMMNEFSKAIAKVITHYPIPAPDLHEWVKATKLAIAHDHRVMEANEKTMQPNSFSKMADELLEAVDTLPAPDAVACLFMSMLVEIGIHQRPDVMKTALASIGELVIKAEDVDEAFIERMQVNDLVGDRSMNSTSGFMNGEEVIHIPSQGVESDPGLADTLFAKVLGQNPDATTSEGEENE